MTKPTEAQEATYAIRLRADQYPQLCERAVAAEARLAEAAEALLMAKAFIVIGHLAPPIQSFEVKAANKCRETLLTVIEAALGKETT